jgi:hypothetical protein
LSNIIKVLGVLSHPRKINPKLMIPVVESIISGKLRSETVIIFQRAQMG